MPRSRTHTLRIERREQRARKTQKKTGFSALPMFRAVYLPQRVIAQAGYIPLFQRIEGLCCLRPGRQAHAPARLLFVSCPPSSVGWFNV